MHPHGFSFLLDFFLLEQCLLDFLLETNLCVVAAAAVAAVFVAVDMFAVPGVCPLRLLLRSFRLWSSARWFFTLPCLRCRS